MTPLEKRANALSKTQDKYAAKNFKWGSCDCAKIVSFHLKQFGHYVPKPEPYRTARGAQKSILKLGYRNLPELIDGLGFEKIPPAFTLMGDIVSFEADHPIGGIGIVWGNGNMMAFHESHQTPVVMTMGRIQKAWRVM